jgi:hypothetical protein
MALRIIEALDAYLRACEGGAENADAITSSFAEVKSIRADMAFADDGLVEKARAEYAVGSDDNLEVDDGALLSVADEGTWVAAWVWIANEEEEG